MKVIRCFVIFILISVLLTGCWGSREIEHMIYANSVGIDYVKGKVVIYVQLINFTGIAKRESGQLQVQKTYVGKAEADSFDAAIFKLYSTSQQRIAWSHVKTIVFSKAALEQNVINQVLDVWDRYFEFRYTIWTMATLEPIEDIFNAPSIAELSVLYSQLNSPKQAYTQSSIVAPIYLYKFIWKWKEPAATVLLPYLSIQRDDWTSNKKPSPKLQVSGVCALSNGKLKGCLPRQHILGLRWLEKGTVRTPLEVKSEGKNTVFVMTNIKQTLTPGVKDNQATFKLSISMQATIPQTEMRLSKTKLEELAAEEVKRQLTNTYSHGLALGADLLGLSEKLYRAKSKEWHQLEQEGKLPLSSGSIEDIEVKVNLLEGGISKLK